MQVNFGLGCAAAAFLLAGCESGEARTWTPPAADVARIAATCDNALAGLALRIGSGNAPAAYEAAGNARSVCREASGELSPPGRASAMVEQCKTATDAGGMLADLTADAVDDPKPSNVARVGQLREAYDSESAKCQALTGES